MHSCGNCGKSCIPVWRALVHASFSLPVICPRCNARLIRKRQLSDVIAGVPLAVAAGALLHWDIRDCSFAWFYLGSAAFCGVVWWLHFIAYEVADTGRASFLGKGKGRKLAAPD